MTKEELRLPAIGSRDKPPHHRRKPYKHSSANLPEVQEHGDEDEDEKENRQKQQLLEERIRDQERERLWEKERRTREKRRVREEKQKERKKREELKIKKQTSKKKSGTTVDYSDDDRDDSQSRKSSSGRRSPRYVLRPKTPPNTFQRSLYKPVSYKPSLPSLTDHAGILQSARKRRKEEGDEEVKPSDTEKKEKQKEKKEKDKRPNRHQREEEERKKKRSREKKERTHWEDYKRRNERGWIRIENIVKERQEFYDEYVQRLEEKMEVQRENIFRRSLKGEKKMKQREENRITEKFQRSGFSRRWAYYYMNFRPTIPPNNYSTTSKHWRQINVWTC